VEELHSKGHTIDRLDLGGGYGADFETATVPSASQYAHGIHFTKLFLEYF